MINYISTFLLPASLCGSITTISLLLCRPLAKKLKGSVIRGAIFICCLMYLIPLSLFTPEVAQSREDYPGSNINTQETPLSTTPEPSIIYKAGSELSSKLNNSDLSAPAKTSDFNFDFPLIISAIYLAGLSIFLLFNWVPYIVFLFRLKRSCGDIPDEKILNIYYDICLEYNIVNPPELKHSSSVASPCLVGLIKPWLVLPARNTADDGYELALRHELCHFKRRDIAAKHIFMLVSSVHWFNPLIHILRKQFGVYCESACDELVTSGFNFKLRHAYAETLLEYADTRNMPYGVSGFSMQAKNMKARLSHLLRPVNQKPAFFIAACSLLAIFTAAGIFTGCSMASGSKSATSVDSVMQSEKTDISSDVSSYSTTSNASDFEHNEQSSVPSSFSSELTPSAPSNSALLVADETYVWPVPSKNEVGRYFLNGHRGIDIKEEIGEPIVAVKSGKVLTAESHYSYGNYIIIDHGNGLQTLYAHCESLLVKVGDEVETGQQIATIGSTGNSAGPHCHIEFLENEKLLDPMDYINPPE